MHIFHGRGPKERDWHTRRALGEKHIIAMHLYECRVLECGGGAQAGPPTFTASCAARCSVKTMTPVPLERLSGQRNTSTCTMAGARPRAPARSLSSFVVKEYGRFDRETCNAETITESVSRPNNGWAGERGRWAGCIVHSPDEKCIETQRAAARKPVSAGWSPCISRCSRAPLWMGRYCTGSMQQNAQLAQYWGPVKRQSRASSRQMWEHVQHSRLPAPAGNMPCSRSASSPHARCVTCMRLHKASAGSISPGEAASHGGPG